MHKLKALSNFILCLFLMCASLVSFFSSSFLGRYLTQADFFTLALVVLILGTLSSMACLILIKKFCLH